MLLGASHPCQDARFRLGRPSDGAHWHGGQPRGQRGLVRGLCATSPGAVLQLDVGRPSGEMRSNNGGYVMDMMTEMGHVIVYGGLWREMVVSCCTAFECVPPWLHVPKAELSVEITTPRFTRHQFFRIKNIFDY